MTPRRPLSLSASALALAGCSSSSVAVTTGARDATADVTVDASTGDGAALDAGGDGDAGVVAVDGGSIQVFQTSRAGDKFADKGALVIGPVGNAADAGVSVIALTATPKQQILGFGGALTESSASVLSALASADRQAALDAYFSPSGSGYTLARTHIASCDFSLASYQYSSTVDPTLPDFSVAHDEALLIPLLKDATTSSAGALRVLASPWSAPAWMKSPAQLYVPPSAANGYTGVDPVLQTQYYDAYALYLSKYVQAYKAQGVDIWALTPQNEPLGNGGQWETMAWTNVTMNTFVRDHLGPRFKADGITANLFVYDHNKGAVNADYVDWSRTMLTDPVTNPLVYGTATHWYGSTIDVFQDSLEAVHALDPTKAILATEGTLDGLTDHGGSAASATYQYAWLKDDFYWTKDEYDWGYWYATGAAKALHPAYEPVYRYARDIIVGLNHWYAGWIDWNVALDKDGGPNHVNNWCGAGMMVDTTAKTVYYSPIFYVMRHFSKYLRPGAHVLDSSVALASAVSLAGYDGMPTDGLLATAAKNADGSDVIVLFNETAAPIDYAVTAGGVAARGTIPAQALQTLVWSGAP